MYIERCKHGLGRGLCKPVVEIWQGGIFPLYYKYKKALSEGKSKQEAAELSRKKWKSEEKSAKKSKK